MNAPAPARPGWRTVLTDRGFVVHYLQMVAAMGIGMVVLTPFSMHLVHHAGAEVEALAMVTTMVAGMAVWMAHRLHTWPEIVEMSAAMYGSFAALFPFYWLGVLTPTSLTMLGHLLMLVAMAVAMLHRRDSYAS
jgi:flagellar biosynthetic protein FliP